MLGERKVEFNGGSGVDAVGGAGGHSPPLNLEFFVLISE